MQIDLTEDEKQVLEEVRKRLNLPTLDEAAQVLFKSQLKQSLHDLMAGRGRSLYVVKK